MIQTPDITINPHDYIANGWALLTAGNKDHFNVMTINWGSFGFLWNKSICTVYVKPIRYTFEFLMENDYFTISFLPEEYKKDMLIIGTKSGRDLDKLALTSLTPESLGDTMTYKEANRTIVLKKIYASPFVKQEVPDFAHEKYYQEEAEHYMFIGEVVGIYENRQDD